MRRRTGYASRQGYDPRWWRWGTALVLATVLGCQSKPAVELPKTYPVKGKVTRQSGEVIVKGAVQFRPLGNTSVSAIGEIQPDGSYALQTIVGNEIIAGAVVGEHEVTVIPQIEGNHARDAILMPKPYSVGPQENDIPLTIP
jgi:hypothetical protein